jgi:hypothetical protein
MQKLCLAYLVKLLPQRRGRSTFLIFARNAFSSFFLSRPSRLVSSWSNFHSATWKGSHCSRLYKCTHVQMSKFHSCGFPWSSRNFYILVIISMALIKLVITLLPLAAHLLPGVANDGPVRPSLRPEQAGVLRAHLRSISSPLASPPHPPFLSGCC